MEKRFKPLKQITLEEATEYISAEEDFNNNFICFYTLTFSNEWTKVSYYTARRKKTFLSEGEGKEIIYIMSNSSIPGLLKIGYTGKSAEQRVKELSKPTGIPTPFKLEFTFKLHGRGEELEKEIHRVVNFLT